jgi:hypothetical protein
LLALEGVDGLHVSDDFNPQLKNLIPDVEKLRTNVINTAS